MSADRLLPLKEFISALDCVSAADLEAQSLRRFDSSVPPGVHIPDELMSAWNDCFWRFFIIQATLTARSPKRVAGTVYLAESDGLLKIGHTTRPVQERMSQLSAGRAADVTLIGSFAGTLKDERTAQARFAEHRHRGEWFRDAAEIREYFAEKSVSS